MEQERKQRIIEIVNEIYRVLRSDQSVFWSWGSHDVQATIFRDMPALMMRVEGFIHKGKVIVALNEGKDTYEVYALNEDGTVKNEKTDVYVDELVGVCDRMIETENPDSDEYKKQCDEAQYFL